MSEAIFALVGAAVGSMIPAAVTIYATWRHERQAAQDDRQDARDARLFEHRRDAHQVFWVRHATPSRPCGKTSTFTAGRIRTTTPSTPC